MRIHTLLATLVIGLPPFEDAAAQHPANPPRVHAALAKADSATVFRLRLSAGATMQGQVLALDSASVTLGTSPRTALARVDSLWKRGTARKQGRVIGTFVGAIGGVVAGNYFANITDAYGGEKAPYMLGGAVIGAAIGFGLGSLFGASATQWLLLVP